MNTFATMSRRTFIKTFASGVAVGLTITGLPSILRASESVNNKETIMPDWAPQPGIAQQRIDGLPKVLGKKIYARDYRAIDMPLWPKTERILYALRCNKINQIVTRYDLSMLPEELRPLKVIDYQTLTDDHVIEAGGMDKPFFTELGQSPLYYGQPVAILIFKNFDVYRKAEKILQFSNTSIIYVKKVRPQLTTAYDPTSEYVRDDSQQFNYSDSADTYDSRYKQIATDISTDINSGKWNVFSRDFKTQTMDPMFMEPESGLTWYDAKNKKLHLVVGTQSPTGDIAAAAEIFSDPSCSFKLDAADGVELVSCYPGGGFGGRDKSYFPMYLAMAAPYADGPLRWAHSRFEQFQVGLKRHHTLFSETLAFDNSGILQGMECEFTLNGGGRKNLSPFVAQLAALSSFSAYEIPRAIANGKAMNTPDLVGGSQRGFGGPQAFMAIETLIDEAAIKLNIDPFTLRRKNFLNANSKTITGAPVEKNLRLDEILNTLEKHPLWTNRFADQKKYAARNLNYGVGVAMSNQAYGTSGDGMYGGIQINEDGSITVRTPYIDMGNGAATTLGLAPSTWLGRNASDIRMGDAGFFDALGLTTSGSSTQANFVLKGSGSSSACLGAFYQYHAIEQAGITLLIESVIPAAIAIWGVAIDHTMVQWQDNKLSTAGQADIEWKDIVNAIYKLKLPNVTAVHATYVGQFSTADFTFKTGAINLPLDYVAMGVLDVSLNTLPRTNLVNPPPINSRYKRTTYAPCGALTAVSVDRITGQVKVEDCVSVLNAGLQLSPELVSGQSQGGIAMAIGYVFFENCPNTDDGPGNGTWNLDKYYVAHMADIPKNQQLIVLDPAPGETTARGIAEAVMCPTPPALLNALAMATGNHRFSTLPVTTAAIKEVLG